MPRGNSQTGKHGDRRILVTGFGAFPGTPVNPTETLVAALATCAAPPGVALSTRLLPVSWTETARLLEEAIAEIRPDAVLMFGVAGRSRAIRIEMRAANRAHVAAADAGGRLVSRDRLDVDGPAYRRARCDGVALLRAAAALGVPARVSRDAGTYLCNAALWTALAATEETVPVAFVHVPPSERLPPERLLAVARAMVEMVGSE
jgi:pyroglutamyl-peptidase